MEAWNDAPRVRPIPIGDDESPEVGSGAPGRPGEPPRRPWLPVALSALAVVVIVGSVALFGAIQDDDPVRPDEVFAEGPDGATSTSTTTTLSLRTLEEAVPGLTSRLTLIAQGPGGPTALLWDPSFVQPKPFPIEYNPDHTARFVLDDAAFDASGDFVRILGRDTATNTGWMWVGSPTDVAAIDIPNVRGGAVWHAHDVHQLVWISESPDQDGWSLHTARLNPLSLELQPTGAPIPVPSLSEIIRWDRDGFVINDPLTTSVIAIGPTGTELWRTVGSALAASDSTVLVARAYFNPPEVDEENAAQREPTVTSVVALGRADGVEAAVALDERAAEDQAHRSMWITSSTDLLARVDVVGQSTRLELTGGPLATLRSLRQNDDVLPLGFVDNDSYFVFASDGGNDLIFVNWNKGSIHELPLPDQYRIVGFATG